MSALQTLHGCLTAALGLLARDGFSCDIPQTLPKPPASVALFLSLVRPLRMRKPLE